MKLSSCKPGCQMNDTDIAFSQIPFGFDTSKTLSHFWVVLDRTQEKIQTWLQLNTVDVTLMLQLMFDLKAKIYWNYFRYSCLQGCMYVTILEMAGAALCLLRAFTNAL